MKLILGFIGIVAVLWILWFFAGGPRKFEENPQGKFIKPLQIDAPAETYN
jgi:hypothetical protein